MKRVKEINLSKKKEKIILLTILLAGLLIRLIYLYFFKDTVFLNPYLMDKHDQKTFILWAEKILRHPFYVDGKVFYMAPFYPYFLTFLYLITGGSITGILIFHAIIDTGTCFLLYLTGKKLFNEKVGLISAFLACFYKTYIVYSISILSDSIILFLYVFFFYLLLLSLERPNFKWWIITGIILGFSALAKPTIAIYLPFLLYGLFYWKEKKFLPFNISHSKQAFLTFSLLIFVSGLTILPVTIRNFIIGHKFVPICSNGPANWAIGNSSDSIGLFFYPKGEILSPFSLSFWKMFLLKLKLFFVSYEWPQNMNVYLTEKVIPFLKLAFVKFGFVVPVGVTGFFLMFKDFKKNYFFITYTVFNVLWVVLFFITDRYRLPAVACFIISSSYFIVWVYKKLIKDKTIIFPFLSAVFIFIFAYLFDITPGPLIPDESKKVFAFLSVKNIKYDLKNKNIRKVKKEAEKFYEILPNDEKSNFLLACVYYELGEIDKTIYYLKKALQINPSLEPAKRFLKDISK